MRRFDFLCIGFTKCGTTTLHEILKQHEDIYLPIIKEPLFYYDPELYQKGYKWYCNRFYPHAINTKLLGEINPSITLKNSVSKVIRDNRADTKIIFMVRNPVDRAFSDFKYAERNVYFDTDQKGLSHGKRFDYIVSKGLKEGEEGVDLINGPYRNILDVGRYFKRIQEALGYFGQTNIKFIVFEEFIKDPQQVCEELFEFLGIRKITTLNYQIKANEGNRIKRNELCGYLYDFLMEERKKLLLKTPFLGEGIESFVENLYGYLYIALTKQDRDRSKMSAKTREKLQDFYREDKDKLQVLIKKNLNAIWYE